jgi:general secretion pathway protein J
MSPTHRTRGDAGFTLLELLVAMTLLAMVFGLIAGGIGFGAAVWEKGGASAKRAGDLQTAHRVLRGRIEAMQPHRRPREKRQALLPFAVDGKAEALVFVAPPPAELAPPGLYRYRIAIEGSGRDRSLTLAWRRLQPDLRDFDADADTGSGGGGDADGKDKDTSGSVVLMDGIAGGRIDYFGAIRPKDPEEWQDRWEDAPRLPALVRLTLEFDDADPRQWPPLIVAPMVEGLR